MRLLILLCLSVFFVSSVAVSQDAPEAECEIEKPKRKTVRKIDRWIQDSRMDRSGAPKQKLLAELQKDAYHCRDIIALEHALYILDVRHKSSPTAPESAFYIASREHDYTTEFQVDAIMFLLRHYKQTEQFDELVKVAQFPSVKMSSRTLVAARDSAVLSNFALGFDQQTLDMLRPLADKPINSRDWWLMTFSSALAEHLEEPELASVFQAKADSAYAVKREYVFQDRLEGPRVQRMLQQEILNAHKIGLDDVSSRMEKLPKPNYPVRALERRESGFCDVIFDVTVAGRTENVRAYCSSDLFKNQAERALKRVRFRVDQLEAKPRKDVIYPLEFSVF